MAEDVAPTTTIAPAPDPAVTTTPQSTSNGMAPPVVDDPDWEAQEQLPARRFRDEVEDEEAEAGADAETQKAAEEAKKAEEAAEASKRLQQQQEQQSQQPSERDAEELKARADLFDQFNEVLTKDPATVFNALLQQMNPIDRATILRQHYVENVRPTFDAENYEPQGEMEEALRDRWEDIDSIPEIARETRSLDQRITAMEQGRTQDLDPKSIVPHVTHAAITAEIAIAKLEALCDLLGIELPDPDIKELQAAYDQKADYRTNVRKVTGKYKDTVEAKKQANAPRPKTPANGTTREPTFKFGMSAVEMAKAMGTLPG